MTGPSWLQISLTLALTFGLALPLGLLLARLFEGTGAPGRFVVAVERALLRQAGTAVDDEMDFGRYARAVLLFTGVGALVVYAMQRAQGVLPLNPLGLGGVEPGVAMNTAVSFASNTNWQAYSGESTMSFATQMLALTTQNFVSAAAGIAVLLAVARGFTRAQTTTIGNFWSDLVRSTLVLLPLSLVMALLLVHQGVPQTFSGTLLAKTLESGADQLIALGPVASQVAIKQLGTNGGGFYGVNSAHPLENPTPFANLLEVMAIILIPAALCFTWGRLVRNRAHGLAMFLIMLVLVLPAVWVVVSAEQAGNPLLAHTDQVASALQSGGNMEGKEVRFGIAQSGLWAVLTTAASNGSVNAMHDSFTPIGGLVPMLLMQLGEVVFGGVGSGLYGLLLYVIIAVFIAGLMVGRTPELLGKKIEAFEMKMATLGIVGPSALVLVGTAIACVVPDGNTVANPGAHGFSEILYAFSSAANNNGSAFGGLTVNGGFYTSILMLCMWLSRFVAIIAVLAIAASLAGKRQIPTSSATLPAHGPVFVGLVAATVLLVGALTFVPALALGPIVEQLQTSTGASSTGSTP